MNKLRGFFAVPVLLSVLLSAVSCGQASKAALYEAAAPSPEPAAAKSMLSDSVSAGQSGTEGFGSPDAAKDVSSSPASAPVSRKRVVTGTLELQTEDLPASLAAVGSQAAALGGYAASSQVEASWAQIVLRIPADRYDQLLSRLSSRGKVLRSWSQIEDVTEQWFDLDTRVRSKRILIERYQTYLRQAKNIEELMKIERQLNDVTTEIEQLEGSFRMLENRIDYSTLTVTLSLPGSPDRRGFDLGGALADFTDNTAGFFMRFLMFVLYFLAIGIPLVLFLALVWLLLFGRVGLVRRLFALVSGNHARPKAET